MNELSCLLEIQHRYSSLTSAEKRIADYITRNSEKVLLMPIGKLAELTGTAKSAVVRCSQSLGFDGYSALKISLAADVTNHVERDYSNTIDFNEGVDSIVNKIFSANIKTLQDTQRFLDLKVLNGVADAMAKANMIYLYGIGSSAILAKDLQHRLFQVGYVAVVATDVTTMKDSTLSIKKGDLAFAYCDSGRTVVTIETLKLAQANGAITCCLTGYSDSPITKICDYVLHTTADEFKYPIESITSRVARIAVTDALIVTLSVKNYSNTLEKTMLTRKQINNTRYPKVEKR